MVVVQHTKKQEKMVRIREGIWGTGLDEWVPDPLESIKMSPCPVKRTWFKKDIYDSLIFLISGLIKRGICLIICEGVILIVSGITFVFFSINKFAPFL
ncbi:MAG: hypothetical protein A4E54_02028 [Pelotomaculum sp. PtaB.Bin117]|nr:MAG: hypothetical protein A4E54_02028 [Pelotomaculum sp. PtaB.Bin117]OPY61330.1 MAG: hypothetical protein A4E56_02115 [Pelotomaculum sp. PtaU1.Bin065]